MSRTKLAILRIFTLFAVPACIFATTDLQQQLQRPSGRVSLFSFERGHLRTVTDGVDAEVVLTMPPRYFEAYLFECNATYPVQWAYIGEAAPVVTADVGRFFRDFYDVNTYTYQSILLMYSLQELQSGRYICRGASKEHDKLAISYDVFVPGNGTQILLSTAEKKLFVPEDKEHAYIPCGVSDSTAVVNLYRGNQWGTFYPVPVNGSITFNARKGFKIKFKDFLDPWGTYLCVVANNKKRRKVHLIPESVKAKYEMINHVNGKIPVYFSYEYEYNRILCCTGTNFIPKLQWAGCGSILDCQVKSACFEEDRCEHRLGNSGYNPTKWIDPGPLPPGCSGYRLRDDPNGDFGLFKCSTPGIAQYQPYLLNRGNIFLDFEKTPPSEMILTLQRISPEGPSFVGDEVEFHCNSTRFYFAYGIRWGWEKHGGEIDFVDDSTVIRDKYSVKGHRRRTTFKIPHQDIKSIICFVPVVNSATEWRTVSLPVVIAVNDINVINNQNPTPNVIDLDSLTYHTDYDSANPTPGQHQQGIQHQQQNHQQHVDLQTYNGANAPTQEFQPLTTSGEQQENPNYYKYAHESSDYPTANIVHTHPQNPVVNNVHSHPIPRPQQVDVYSPAVHAQAATASPTIVSISRSAKKTKITSSSSSASKSGPVLKPEVHYDPLDRDYSSLSPYDSSEPSPSSSSNTNSKLHGNNKEHHHHEKQHISQNMRAPSSPRTSRPTSPLTSSKRPSSSSQSSHNYRDEHLHHESPKSHKEYTSIKEEDQFGVDMRLSLPFESAIPSRSKHAHASSNYSTISSRDPLTRTYSRSHSRSRTTSRRPSSSSSSSSSASPAHSHSSSAPRHNNYHNYPNQPEKEYAVEDSYSQHVRLSLPSNSVSTRLPKLEKSSGRSHSRTRQRINAGHGHGRSHSSSSTSTSSHRNPDYYYTDEISPVEIQTPRAKAHEHDLYSSNSRYRQHHQHQNHHNHPSTSQPKEIYRDTSAEPEIHVSSPTTHPRRRPYSEDLHSRPTSQSNIYGDHPKQSSSSHHHQHHSQPRHQNPQQQQQPLHQQQNRYQQRDQQENYKSSGRHWSRSRGLKFGTDTAADRVDVDAYEQTSPTARPAYFMSHNSQLPQQQQLGSNEYINADMELKRLKPHRTSSRPAISVKGNSNNSSDILHSVSISISSRVSHAYDDEDERAQAPPHQSLVDQNDDAATRADSEAHETEDYDIYSPQHTNYKSSTTAATSKPVVPIQFFHVKPTDVSSFQPARSFVEEEDDDDVGFG